MCVPEWIAAAVGLAVAALPALAEQPDPMAARLVDAEGAVVTLGSALGPQPLVVNLWATWCAPCIEELPALAALDQWLRPQGGQVLLVAAEPADPALINRALHERFGVTTLSSHVDRAGLVTAALGIRAFPATVVLGRDGEVLELISGAEDWDDPAVRARLAQWLLPEQAR